MARCASCNRFVSYGDPRTDEIDVEVDGDGTVTLSGTLYLTCCECGDDVKSAEMSAELYTSTMFDDEGIEEDDVKDGGGTLPDFSYEIDGDPTIEATERTRDTDRNGKKIKNPRYVKTFFGVSAEVTVKRTATFGDGDPVEESVMVTVEAEEQASGFDDCG